MPMIPPDKIRIFFISFLVLFLGCASTMTQEKLAQKKEEIELKKQRWTELSQEIHAGTLAQGTLIQVVETKFGKPDDVFRSGSTDSSFEVWTYEKITTETQEESSTIRLYFNNGKLINWKY